MVKKYRFKKIKMSLITIIILKNKLNFFQTTKFNIYKNLHKVSNILKMIRIQQFLEISSFSDNQHINRISIKSILKVSKFTMTDYFKKNQKSH
jgi:hypothetical protein